MEIYLIKEFLRISTNFQAEMIIVHEGAVRVEKRRKWVDGSCLQIIINGRSSIIHAKSVELTTTKYVMLIQMVCLKNLSLIVLLKFYYTFCIYFKLQHLTFGQQNELLCDKTSSIF